MPKISLTICWTRGIRVEPPTSTTSSISDALSLASSRALMTGAAAAIEQVVGQLLELAPVEGHRQVLGAVLVSGVMNGRLMSA